MAGTTGSAGQTFGFVASRQNAAPLVRIISPLDGATFSTSGFDFERGMYYREITLMGEATDPEDGRLGGTRLRWTNSLNGAPAEVLGSGERLTVRLYAPNCFGNSQQITLTATDSQGFSQSVAITIVVSLLC